MILLSRGLNMFKRDMNVIIIAAVSCECANGLILVWHMTNVTYILLH